MLCRSAPAGTIGYTMSCFSTTNSISTGPSLMLCAHSIAGVTSSRRSTRRAGMPYASASLTKSGVIHRRGVVAFLVEELLPLAHHAQVAVVDDGDLDRDALLHGGRQFGHGHLETAVAAQSPTHWCS